MSDVIPFPGTMHAVGETFPSERLSAGVARAVQSGISRDRLDALLAHDRPLATYMLCFLGSADPGEQRMGMVGVSRLLGSMECAA